jgi:uncharacterized protein
MTVWLLDGNVLVAIADQHHVHHERAHGWFAPNVTRFSTCPITQGALLRMFARLHGPTPMVRAWEALASVVGHPMHEFWPDVIDYQSVDHSQLLGQRQITDAYLAALARHNKGRVATFDRGFAAQHPDVVTNIGAP